LERQAFKLKGNEMNDIAKQQEEMFFIATDWDKTTDAGRPDFFYQEVGSSVKDVVEKFRTNKDRHPMCVYVVSKQLVAQAVNYI
jgi:predicted RNA-binding protein associated with RNAse of E/G family